MPGIFGESVTPNANEGYGDEVTDETTGPESEGHPEGNDDQGGRDEPFGPNNTEGHPNKDSQSPTQNAGPDDEQEPQGQQQQGRMYAGKYKTVEDMEKAVTESQSMIGKMSQELGQYRNYIATQQGQAFPQVGGGAMTPQQPYQGMPQMYGQQQAPQTMWSNDGRQNQQALSGQLQQLGAQSGLSPQQQGQMQQQVRKALKDMDPDEYWEKISDPGSMEDLMQSSVMPVVQGFVSQQLNSAAQQYIAPMVQQVQVISQMFNQMQIERNWEMAASQLATQHEDFAELFPKMQEVYQNNPAHTALLYQDPVRSMAAVYQEVKSLDLQASQQQGTQQQTQAGKMAARMPSSTGRRTGTMTEAQQTSVDLFGTDLVGGSGKRAGVFG